MPDTLGGYWLDAPQLRFDYENRKAVSDDAYTGLRTLGPYDIAERLREGKKVVRAAIIGRADRPRTRDAVVAALTKRRMGRLHDVFELRFVDQLDVPPADPKDEAAIYREAVRRWLAEKHGKVGLDLVFVLHEDEEVYRRKAHGASPYYATKAALLMAHVPTQSICYKNVTRDRIQEFEAYYVANILTACYAKLGGTPWVIQDDVPGRPEITLGVATTSVRSDDGSVERFVGISTIFKENGAFSLWDITPVQLDLEQYETALERSITHAITTFEKRESRIVSRIACHVSGKRAGHRELDAIQRALGRFPGRVIAADLVHVTDDAILWLFDGRDSTNRPEAGFLTQLTNDGGSALLHTDGRDGKGARKFPIRPLKLGLHSEMPADGCRDVYQHLYDLRWMSWRGVGTAARPVSVDYPARMSKLLANLYAQEEVEAINFLPGLTDSAWFL